ncbi:unnamed protein product [Vitrella brassicaformis CCMP3155]|uniref:Uncharacterized protein n=1 Tax=Vitrella brassicaformis (strain CCMP3155) TaxID=1169540 RepID=A0A0G4FQE5_VITBC|nr:unnamed protein product [Vitrella brassicaformis CCMP3155]|eukprot:CEM16501.1 unnamed protein product [Vitrella brassicaformis CCMP3155]
MSAQSTTADWCTNWCRIFNRKTNLSFTDVWSNETDMISQCQSGYLAWDPDIHNPVRPVAGTPTPATQRPPPSRPLARMAYDKCQQMPAWSSDTAAGNGFEVRLHRGRRRCTVSSACYQHSEERPGHPDKTTLNYWKRCVSWRVWTQNPFS